MPAASLIIKVDIKHHHGLYSASSNDVPGLHVCEDTPEKIRESIMKAVKILFKYNREMDVDVTPATEDPDSFPSLPASTNKFIVHPVGA